MILHNPEQYILEGKSILFDELDKYKEKGIIRGYGVSIDSLEELKLVLYNLDVDVIEIMFNIVHQEVKELFDEVQNKGILLIIKVPLDSGWLTGKYNEKSIFTGIRERWTEEDKIIRASIINKIKIIVEDEDLVLTALRFILSFDAVTTVIPGTKNILQLKNNCIASDDLLSSDVKSELEDLYQDYIKTVKTPW